MPNVPLILALFLFSSITVSAQSVDEIISRYLKSVGGLDKIHAVNTLRRTGKFIGGGGFEAVIVQENKRGNLVREEFTLQGMTGINAYDGTTAWTIQPWNGKKDPESLGEEEMKSILEDADFDGPLVDYQKKGYKIEFAGKDKFEGTETVKLKITNPNGDIYIWHMDTDYYVPIKVDVKRFVRGAEREYETVLGDYKEVAGWFMPFSIENNVKGSPNKSKIVYEVIQANVDIDDARFKKPTTATAPKTN
jgi:hypothetical protein